MRKIILPFLLCLYSLQFGFTQDLADAYDFWVGEWEVSWEEAEGKTGIGINRIVYKLDSTVIQENFEILEGTQKGFKGTSISVFNPHNKVWHQAWADNQGGFYNFIGEITDTSKIFKTIPRELADGSVIIQRMVFYNIQANQLTWDWEHSFDGGENWTLDWRIFYRRKE